MQFLIDPRGGCCKTCAGFPSILYRPKGWRLQNLCWIPLAVHAWCFPVSACIFFLSVTQPTNGSSTTRSYRKAMDLSLRARWNRSLGLHDSNKLKQARISHSRFEDARLESEFREFHWLTFCNNWKAQLSWISFLVAAVGILFLVKSFRTSGKVDWLSVVRSTMMFGFGCACAQKHMSHYTKKALRLWVNVYGTCVLPPLVLYEQCDPKTPTIKRALLLLFGALMMPFAKPDNVNLWFIYFSVFWTAFARSLYVSWSEGDLDPMHIAAVLAALMFSSKLGILWNIWWAQKLRRDWYFKTRHPRDHFELTASLPSQLGISRSRSVLYPSSPARKRSASPAPRRDSSPLHRVAEDLPPWKDDVRAALQTIDRGMVRVRSRTHLERVGSRSSSKE